MCCSGPALFHSLHLDEWDGEWRRRSQDRFRLEELRRATRQMTVRYLLKRIGRLVFWRRRADEVTVL